MVNIYFTRIKEGKFPWILQVEWKVGLDHPACQDSAQASFLPRAPHISISSFVYLMETWPLNPVGLRLAGGSGGSPLGKPSPRRWPNVSEPQAPPYHAMPHCLLGINISQLSATSQLSLGFSTGVFFGLGHTNSSALHSRASRCLREFGLGGRVHSHRAPAWQGLERIQNAEEGTMGGRFGMGMPEDAWKMKR